MSFHTNADSPGYRDDELFVFDATIQCHEIVNGFHEDSIDIGTETAKTLSTTKPTFTQKGPFLNIVRCKTIENMINKKSFKNHVIHTDRKQLNTRNTQVSAGQYTNEVQTEGVLSPHRTSSYPNELFRCFECCRDFKTKTGLDQHIRSSAIHNGVLRIRVYMCEICKKVFKFKDNCRFHMFTHTKERPHACDLCHRRYTRKEYLRVHRRIHTGEKPYYCNFCGTAFHCRQSYVNHRRKHSIF